MRGAFRIGLALILLLYVTSEEETVCEDTFLDGKENACNDYIANVDVSLGQGSSCSTLFCDTCKYAGFCDKACVFCVDTSPTSVPSLSPTPMPVAPTSDPTSNPTTPPAP